MGYDQTLIIFHILNVLFTKNAHEEKLGLKYYFGTKSNQFVGVFMKVHVGSIDYIEWTYGINLDVFR